MIVAAHQPHFLPWLGYVNKLVHCDAFIWLDTVQYRKNYFQNRTRIAAADGVPRWLTLPVHAHLETSIRDVRIADPRWRDKVVKTVEQTYGKAPHFAACWAPLRSALLEPSDSLNDVNYRLFRTVLDMLCVRQVHVHKASELGIEDEEPTARLVKLCTAVGASVYVAGKGGRNYMQEDTFAAADIRVVWQQFDASQTAYARGSGVPAPGLSIIDCLFYAGPQQTLDLAQRAWTPE